MFSDQVLFLLAGVAAEPGVDLVGLLVPFLAGVASGVLAEEEDGCEAATTSSSEFSSPSESDTSGVTFPICKLGKQRQHFNLCRVDFTCTLR